MAPELRALVLTPDFPPAVGGIQTVLHRVLEHAKGLRPRVVTLRHENGAFFDAGLDFPVHRVPRTPLGYRATIGLLNADAVQQALRHRPQVILSGHIVVAPAATLIRRVLGVPVAQYLHGYELAARPSLTSFAVRHAEANIAVSHYTKEVAIRAGASRRRVHVIPNGVDADGTRPPVERNSAPTVLTVAQLSYRYKGHDVMLRALPLVAARVPEVRWVVVGEGPLRPELETLAQSYGVRDRVRFVGRVSDSERDAWYHRAHVFAMPARTPAAGVGEGFGIAFLEANAHGLPVVAGAVGGALEAVVDGETGVLVEPTDHIAVADAITDLLEDPEGARRLGAVGAERARREFAWPSIAARVEALLRSSAEQPR